ARTESASSIVKTRTVAEYRSLGLTLIRPPGSSWEIAAGNSFRIASTVVPSACAAAESEGDSPRRYRLRAARPRTLSSCCLDVFRRLIRLSFFSQLTRTAAGHRA